MSLNLGPLGFTTKMFKFIQKLNKSHINYNSDSRGRSGYSRSSAEFRVFSWLLLAPRKLQACTPLPVINLKVFSLFPFVHFYCFQLLSQDASMNLGYRCFRRGLISSVSPASEDKTMKPTACDCLLFIPVLQRFLLLFFYKNP